MATTRDDGPAAADLQTRLADLERRVHELESDKQPVAKGVKGSEKSDDDPADTFWALEGLRARLPESGGVVYAGAVMLPDGRTAHWQQGATTAALLDTDFSDYAASLSALGHPVRLRIVQRFLTDTSSVPELVDTGEFGTSGQIYHHVRQLLTAGWLRQSGRGQYEVPVDRAVPLLTILLGAR